MQQGLRVIQVRLNFPEESTADISLDHTFPIEQANILAERESFNKHLFRPNTYLHKWWARRSGTTFRHILKQLSDQPVKRDYYAIGGLEGKVILDPMMGGGTTIHEAIRLGASVVGYDIDPIPVLQARASLTLLPFLAKKAVFDSFYAAVHERLAPLFETSCPKCDGSCESQFTLYGLRKRCACGEALFVDSYQLREETNGSFIEIKMDRGYLTLTGTSTHSLPLSQPVYEKTVRQCPHCGSIFNDIRDEPFANRYVPLVVVGACNIHGQFFKAIDERDVQRMQAASDLMSWHVNLPLDELKVPRGPKSDDLLNRGIGTFAEVFTPRQLLYVSACKELLDAVDPEHRLWLALLISTSLEFNSLLCGYKGADKRRAGAIRHVFSHHAYSFPHTALENNPVFSGNTSGTLGLLFEDRIEATSLWASAPVERIFAKGRWSKVTLNGEMDSGTPVTSAAAAELAHTQQGFLIGQLDSSRLPLPDESVDHVVIDPPYYDSVQYSDLASFFRAWLRWMLPGEANWDYDVADSAVAESDKNGAKYQRVLSGIWRECHRVLKKPLGRLVFTFHHWRPEAWARLTLSLKAANFRLVTSYTIYAENPISVHIRQLKALKHDSVLVLASLREDKRHNEYSLPQNIDTSSSAAFCEGCANLLGYCLESDLSETEIMQLWRSVIENAT
jgi:putative DNA methylase